PKWWHAAGVVKYHDCRAGASEGVPVEPAGCRVSREQRIAGPLGPGVRRAPRGGGGAVRRASRRKVQVVRARPEGHQQDRRRQEGPQANRYEPRQGRKIAPKQRGAGKSLVAVTRPPDLLLRPGDADGR